MSRLDDYRRIEREQAETLSQVSALDVTRHLVRSGATPLQKARVWALLADEASRQANVAAERARYEGASFGEIADALQMTRQGARKRYGHLESVS